MGEDAITVWLDMLRAADQPVSAPRFAAVTA